MILCRLFRALTKPFVEETPIESSESGKPAKPDAGATIEVFRIPLTKDQLRAVPADERNLLLLASHAVNQISVLRRVLIFSLNYESPSAIENTLSAAQSQSLLRLLLAALAEAWVMLDRPIHHRLIGKDYAPDIEPEGKAAHDRLKKHFGRSGLLHNLRNEIIYHYPQKAELEKAFDDAPEGEDWAWYPSDTINNSFYLATDLVIMTACLQQTGEGDTLKAFQEIMGLAIPISNDMTDFFLYLMRAIVVRRIDPKLLDTRPGTGTKVENVPDLYKVKMPFFTFRNH